MPLHPHIIWALLIQYEICFCQKLRHIIYPQSVQSQAHLAFPKDYQELSLCVYKTNFQTLAKIPNQHGGAVSLALDLPPSFQEYDTDHHHTQQLNEHFLLAPPSQSCIQSLDTQAKLDNHDQSEYCQHQTRIVKLCQNQILS